MDEPSIHFCGELFLPTNDSEGAIRKALEENPANAALSTDIPVSPAGGIASLAVAEPSAIGLYVRKMWAPGRTLRVRFLGGNEYLWQKVKQYAVVWSKHANIQFQFVDSGDTEIRVGFTMGIGSWSYVGTDNLKIDKNEATMNFGWFDNQTPDEEFSRTIVHEFGHAIGCIHEHQQPNGNIQWNKPLVYATYRRTQGWSAAQVDSQVFNRYDSSQVTASVFDAQSIMEYPIPKEFTLNGFSAPSNNTLSSVDIAFIGMMYPFNNESAVLEAGVFNTMSIRSWDQPANENRSTIKFANTCQSPPTILLGINWIDQGSRNNKRINAVVEGVTSADMTLNLQSWGDTVNYSAGAAWLQIPAASKELQSGQFNTKDDHGWETQQAETSRRIQFQHPYDSPPKVVVFLTYFDIDYKKVTRIKTYVTDVKADAFTVHIDTWADTTWIVGGVTWFAYPSNKKNIASGTYSTNDIRSASAPRLANSNRIEFNDANFSTPPTVFMGLNCLDVDKSTNLRIRASASSITPTGMMWHLDGWADTTLYGAGASYIAF
ncbi:zincin [Gymnopus androsaceus JB14]|uniref:Zincin n=1 Tax=Gymnopus androsaceus JB14 TaxID=1447944 RepID=A0A6A4GV33_9AGAR|nr:zincin [Gymnopus androsaceus JB14]